ncbi:hypothetical protein SESBI_06778 [Sesbania bispinosa]|nr:hypothetical protein SESBI_06778 [Sesbania bispinosa]
MTQNNRDIHTSDYHNQILSSHQSLGTLQRLQSHHISNNFIQGHHGNNIGDSRTQSLVPYASSRNNNETIDYGRMLPLTPSSGLPQHMGSHNNPPSLPSHVDSIQNSSFNGVGLQGYTDGFSYPLRTTFYNQMNLPYLPHGENSLHMNNSSMSNDFNSYPMVDMNNFQGVNDTAIPRILPPVKIQDLNILDPSTNDLAHERSMGCPFYENQETDITLSASTRPRMSFTPPNYYEGMQTQMEELLLFRDGDNPVYTSEIITDANENDGENLDLSLHL